MKPGRRAVVAGLVSSAIWPFSDLQIALAQADVVKVGAIFPLSGGAGPQGQHIVQGLQAMADIINQAGGVLGRSIEIETRDEESTPAVGVSRATELVTEKVPVIFEGWVSSVSLAMQPIIARANVLDITVFSKAEAILSGENNPLAIRLNSSVNQDAQIAAEYIKSIGASRIAFVVENDIYGISGQEAIEGALNSLNYRYEKIAEERFPFSQTDFRVLLTNLRAAKPDLTMVLNANEGAGLPAFIRQARRARLPGKILCGSGTLAPSVTSLAGEDANGVAGAEFYFPDQEPFASNVVNQRFIEKMKEKFDLIPDKYMALSATALQIWAQAVNDIKTFERQEVARRIRGGKFKETVMGDVKFAPNGQMETHLFTFEIQDGKFVIL